MKRIRPLALLLITGGLASWMGLYPVNWENWLGFSRYDYFTAGTNYAFASGPGPMFLTAAGLSTIIAGLWHHVNCHQDGCLRIGRHKVGGTPWCGRHHELARQAHTDQHGTLADVIGRLDKLIGLIEDQQGAQAP